MGEYKDKEYYDSIYSLSEKYKCNYKESPYLELWKECLYHIPLLRNILEVGCGTGQFYDMLTKEHRINDYIGFDFSKVAISMHTSPNAYVGDARNGSNYPSDDKYDFIICKEVLEHLADDVAVIRKWKKGTEVLITVPCFDDPSHVRWFENEEKIRERFETVYYCLKIDEVIPFQRWFIIKAVTI